jgi:putative endonuclease
MLSNKSRNVLYIGVTNNITRRVYEHKNGLNKGFTKKYNANDLVYYELHGEIYEAIKREKQLKGWSRLKKNNLIAIINPTLCDLSVEFGFEELDYF